MFGDNEKLNSQAIAGLVGIIQEGNGHFPDWEKALECALKPIFSQELENICRGWG